jgi:hypothetical protein
MGAEKMKRPGFTVRRVDLPDDVIELVVDDPREEIGRMERVTAEHLGELVGALGINPPGEDVMAHWPELLGAAAELRELLDETVAELRKVRAAHGILFEETKTLRDELIEARVEIQSLKFAAVFPELVVEPDDDPKFVSDGRGGEIEISELGDLTSDQDPE